VGISLCLQVPKLASAAGYLFKMGAEGKRLNALRMYDALYQWLGTKEGEKDIYRMAKSRERKTRDIIQVKCIKDETGRLLTKDEDIKNRWREYFDKLFNKDSGSSSIELDISSDDLNRHFVHRIQESEVKDALKRMKRGKTMGPDGIPIEQVTETLMTFQLIYDCIKGRR
jgi:hypothetical protein